MSSMNNVKRRKGLNIARKEAITGLLFILPWFIGVLLFVGIPLVRTIYFSFNNVRYSGELGYLYEWIGFENYERILRVDVDFIYEVQNFVVRVFTFVPAIIAISVFIAVLLNSKIKGIAIFRLIFFLPVIVFSGSLLTNLTNNQGFNLEVSGFAYQVIQTVVPNVIESAILLLFRTVTEVLWYCGIPIIIFLAALQKVDHSIYEAAQIDGASAWNIFWKITLPVIFPLVGIVIVFIVVFMGNFDANPILAIIRDSRVNPARREGYASALAILYALLQTTLIVILFKIFNRKEKVVKA